MSTYRIRPGDTLSAIAARFGTSVQALARANHIRNVNVIQAGEQLTIPGQRDEFVGGRGRGLAGTHRSGSSGHASAPASLQRFMGAHPVGSYGGQCSGFSAVYAGIPGFPRRDGLGPCNGNQMVNFLAGRGWHRERSPQPGDVFSMNIGRYGHTGVVVAVHGNMVEVVDSNWGLNQRVHVHSIPLRQFSGFARRP